MENSITAKPKKWLVKMLREVIDIILKAVEENACDDALKDEVFNIVSNYVSAYNTTQKHYKEIALSNIKKKAETEVEAIVKSAADYVKHFNAE